MITSYSADSDKIDRMVVDPEPPGSRACDANHNESYSFGQAGAPIPPTF
jgi:hypothetical protein